jgi:hypothetical protein
MSSFQVTAFGHGFDIDGYLATTRFRPTSRWRRDAGVGDEARIPKDGFTVELGPGTLPLHEQYRVARQFLEDHKPDLARLRGWPGFESACLTVCHAVGPGVHTFGVFLPAELVALAGELGWRIGVTTYRSTSNT